MKKIYLIVIVLALILLLPLINLFSTKDITGRQVASASSVAILGITCSTPKYQGHSLDDCDKLKDINEQVDCEFYIVRNTKNNVQRSFALNSLEKKVKDNILVDKIVDGFFDLLYSDIEEGFKDRIILELYILANKNILRDKIIDGFRSALESDDISDDLKMLINSWLQKLTAPEISPYGTKEDDIIYYSTSSPEYKFILDVAKDVLSSGDIKENRYIKRYASVEETLRIELEDKDHNGMVSPTDTIRLFGETGNTFDDWVSVNVEPYYIIVESGIKIMPHAQFYRIIDRTLDLLTSEEERDVAIQYLNTELYQISREQLERLRNVFR